MPLLLAKLTCCPNYPMKKGFTITLSLWDTADSQVENSSRYPTWKKLLFGSEALEFYGTSCLAPSATSSEAGIPFLSPELPRLSFTVTSQTGGPSYRKLC